MSENTPDKKQSESLKVFEFGIPARVPIIEENLLINTRNPWVSYGITNIAPQELIRLYNSSPTHRACVQSKWYGVRGEKLMVDIGQENRLVMVNSLGDTLFDIWNKATLDFILYGGFSLNVVWRKDRDLGFELYYMDFSKLRAAKSDLYDRVHHYYYCVDWESYRRPGFQPRKLQAFDPSAEEPSQVFYYTTHSAGNMYYPTPSYWGAATAIATEVEIYNWWYNNICNGLQPSLFVSLSPVPGPEERQAIYENLSGKYGGSNNSGKLFLTFSDNKDQAPVVEQIQPNSSDKQFLEMGEAVQQAILTSHQISSPELLGIQTPGALGAPNHLEAQDHFQHLVIEPIQTEIKTVFEKMLLLRDKTPIKIEVEQFKMVTVPDKAPIETVDVNKVEDVGVQKEEAINEQDNVE